MTRTGEGDDQTTIKAREQSGESLAGRETHEFEYEVARACPLENALHRRADREWIHVAFVALHFSNDSRTGSVKPACAWPRLIY